MCSVFRSHNVPLASSSANMWGQVITHPQLDLLARQARSLPIAPQSPWFDLTTPAAVVFIALALSPFSFEEMVCCWGYTKWVYQRCSLKPASPGGPAGWYGGFAYRAAQLLESHGGTGRRRLWRIRRQAHGGLPCSTRIGLSLGLQVVSAPVPTCSPRQAPL
jgi:hypothetical protein